MSDSGDARTVCVFLSRNRIKNKPTISQRVGGEELGIGGGTAAGKQQAAAECNQHYFLSGEAVVASVGGEGAVDRWACRLAAEEERGGGGHQQGGVASARGGTVRGGMATGGTMMARSGMARQLHQVGAWQDGGTVGRGSTAMGGTTMGGTTTARGGTTG